jgi:hypothetical protein
MIKARDRVLKIRWVGVNEMAAAACYPDLYPLPRDLSGLRRSFERHGYRPEYPIVVRARRGGAEDGAAGFEIVCGVGRHTVARERAMRRVPIVVVRHFDEDDNAARAYAIEDNLFNKFGSSRLSLTHMLVLARALRECGVECAPRHVWEAAGVSPSTYWRAEGSLVRSLGEIIGAHPELVELAFARQVAEIIRNDFAPHFTRLFSGDVEVNTYHQAQGGRRERPARRVKNKTNTPHPGGAVEGAPESDLIGKSDRPEGKTSTATEPAQKKPAKLAKNESSPSLFDLLPS